ncbi:MAG: hypothetical protein Q7R57_09420 [Dehalococcoidales bacterium]|nr:hypothetical protein [Dehalococcoidales bacterium]
MDIGELGGISGIVALLFLLGDKGRELWQSRRHLKIRVRSTDVVWYEDNCSIVIFHVDIENRASAFRTLSDLVVRPPRSIERKQHPFQIDPSQRFSTCLLPNGQSLATSFRELLQPPLDIRPHQSLNKVFAVRLEIPQQSSLDGLPLDFGFYALDGNKQIAKDHIGMSLSQLRTLGSYARTYVAKIKS